MTDREKELLDDVMNCIDTVKQMADSIPSEAGKVLINGCCAQARQYIVNVVSQSEARLTTINEKDATIKQLDKQRCIGIEAQDKIYVLDKHIEYLESKIEYLEKYKD